MGKIARVTMALAMVALLAATFAWTGCAKHPSQEQLQQLEETKQAALAAEQQLSQCQQEKADLEKQLKAKQDELAKAKSEKSMVESKLKSMLGARRVDFDGT